MEGVRIMEDIRPSFEAIAKGLQDFIYNEIDFITESEWFQERVAIVVKQTLKERKKDG
tara:strand:+ start:34 stop:207 length:174 start_codon:yes stop_codon:yes gene_type:complete